METDDITPVDEVRAARLRIARRFDNDPAKLLAHFREVEASMRASGKYRFSEDDADSINATPREARLAETQ